MIKALKYLAIGLFVFGFAFDYLQFHYYFFSASGGIFIGLAIQKYRQFKMELNNYDT